jgi:hypothetical protein
MSMWGILARFEDHGLALDVAADRDARAGAWRLLGLAASQDVAEGDDLALLVGDLDADRLLARDGGEDAHVGLAIA